MKQTDQTISQPVVIAGFVSFLFFALEAVLLAALDTTTSYFQAQMIIATSLFGVLIGTAAAATVSKARCVAPVYFILQTLWILPLASLGLALLSFSYPLISIIGLIAVFAPLGFVVSVLYWYASPWRLYASELFGAVGGLGYFIVAIPNIRSENALLALAVLAVLTTIALLWWQLPRAHRVLLFAIAVVCTTGLVANIFNHHINLALHTVCVGDEATVYTESKIACLDDLGTPYQLEISLGSLQNRIDIFKTATDGFYFTAYSGTRNDVMQPFPAEYYTHDARLPAGIVTEPKTLILGAGAEGVAKVVKAIGATDITVVEYNPAVLNVWNEQLPYAESAHRPLADTAVVVGDARLFVEGADDSYDIITLMNTHRSLHAAQFGYPDFLHTKEALVAYLAALSPEGFLSIEEPSYKNEGDVDIARRAQTIIKALEVHGVENPLDHIVAYQWVGVEKDAVIANEYALVYTQILVKKAPWTAEQLTTFRDWAAGSQQTNEFQRPGNMTFFRPIWYPDVGVAEGLASTSVITQPFLSQADTFKILTDIAPFSMTMSPQDKAVLYMFLIMSGVGCVLFLYWYRRSAAEFSSAWLGYFFLIGLAYMTIEMFLLLWLQLYLGSIFITMIVVIGGLFIAGAGASLYYQAKDFSTTVLVAHWLLTCLLVSLLLLLPWPEVDFARRVAIGLGVTLSIGALLAPFFPYAMRLLEVKSKQFTPILIGVNGVALAVAVPASILVATYFGFVVLVVVAAALYGAALAILYWLRV